MTITDPSGLGVPECHTGELTGCHNGVPGKGTKPAKTKSEKKKGTSSSSSSSGGRANSGGSTWAPAPSPSPGKAPAPGPYLGKRVDGPAIQVVTFALFFLPDPVAWKDCMDSPGLSADCASTVGDLPTPLKILKLVKGAKHIDDAAGAAKKAPSGCKCFLPGTDVLLADGTSKNIEDIKLGDQVLATDPETGETGPREVTRLIVTKDDKHFNTLSVMTEDGVEELTATHEHPFWSPSERRWLEARELTAGTTLLSDDGTTVIVTANRAFTKHATTYNLTVADLHTYYVLAGQTPVLVHNSGGCLPALRDWSSQRFQFGNQSLLLDKKGMEHILTRHHPKYWDGSVKKTQSFFDSSMSVDDVQDAIGQVMRQNRDTLVQRGSQGMYQMRGNVNGVDYVLGMNRGRVGQFYPE
ncbi:polymorphic toxin-type HINT domain-containing protein [Streptomyces sp. NPDC056987]|uniref:polymorphic toxin-type HINT domain-containing protein n=1 Tax=Streptomyces sp. NPDC056987 TaxID=3345988 RepID=UPI00362E5987